MDSIAQSLIRLYVALVLLNAILTGVLWWRHRHSLIRSLFVLWALTMLGLITQGATAESSHSLAIVLGFAPVFFVNLTLAWFIGDLVGLRAPFELAVVLWAVALAFSGAFHAVGMSFQFVALPVALAVGFPSLVVVVLVARRHWRELTISGRMLTVTAALFSAHNVDFAFLRASPDFGSIAITIAIILVFAMSIFGPAVVLERISVAEALNRQLTEALLKRFLPAPLVDEIMAGRRHFDEEARSQSITVMFVDLCGFTTLSERLGAARVARILNEYLTAMAEVAFVHGGMVDKFMGDGIMIVFGAPIESSPRAQVEAAVACARDMQKEMTELGEVWKAEGLGEMYQRIGVHHGPAIVGYFGGTHRSDYTAIGPTVNLASRIESACEPGQVFLSGRVRDYLDEEPVQAVGSRTLRGIGTPVRLFRLVDNGRDGKLSEY